MMRSLFSGVSGLKVHQTAMDVIGNNIANVNTVGFRSSNTTFNDIFYQTTKNASGANAQTGRAGTNAIQIGLGSNLAAVTKQMSGQGGMERTDNALDCMINGDAFFIVSVGGAKYFTKSGAFNVDGAGNLCLANGGIVMGWGVSATTGQIEKKEVSALQVMSPDKMYAEPEKTTDTFLSGNIDYDDTQFSEANGLVTVVEFYDNLGNLHNAKLSLKHANPADTKSGKYTVSLADITDAKGNSIFIVKDANGKVDATASQAIKIKLGDVEYSAKLKDGATAGSTDPKDWEVAPTTAGTTGLPTVEFNPSSGTFVTVTNNGTAGTDAQKELVLDFTGYKAADSNPLATLNIDFSSLTQYPDGGKSSVTPTKGSLASGGLLGAGLAAGTMSEISIDNSGKIYATYSNGMQKLLGQIAVASFANPAGLEAVGDSMFAATKNSGAFDGIGKDPTEGSGSIQTGVLEMSNVDLSNEFTHMIVIQRGFQANSRIITTSDTMLEELVNLKR